MKVVITEAGSSVAYHLLYMLGNGEILGNQVERDKWPFSYEGLDRVFLQFIKKSTGLFIIFLGSHYSLFIIFWLIIHYKNGHYSLIIIPHPDPYLLYMQSGKA